MKAQQMDPREFGSALMLSISVHFMIRQLDELKETTLWRQGLKQKGNMFQQELERHARDTMWVERDGAPAIDSVADQMETITDLFHNLLLTAVAADKLPGGQLELFWQHMQTGFKRFGVPLRMTPEGVLELTSV